MLRHAAEGTGSRDVYAIILGAMCLVEVTLYAVLFVVTGRLFILGGAIASAALAINHYRLARKHDAVLAKIT